MLKISFYQIGEADLRDAVLMLVKKTRALKKKNSYLLPKASCGRY
jgi:hypothetical protein